MKSITVLFALLFCLGCSMVTAERGQQDETPAKASVWDFHEHITAERLKYHLEILASDSLMGRGTGQPGIEMAADYIANQFQDMDLPRIGHNRTYFQNFELEATRTKQVEFSLHQTIDDEKEKVWEGAATAGNPTDFMVIFGGTQPLAADISFVGYGLTSPADGIDHVSDASASGNWVMLFGDLPEDADNLPENIDTLMEERITNLLFRSGARGLIIISDLDEEEYLEQSTSVSKLIDTPTGIRLPDRGGRMGFSGAVLTLSPQMAAKMLDLDHAVELNVLKKRLAEDLADFQGYKLDYHLDLNPESEDVTLHESNVMGFIEGCHPELSEEVIVISAHYDHMGLDTPDDDGDMIYNGADDNGSGTVTSIVLAETLHKAKQEGLCLDRSVLVLLVAAEEHGLLGSRYYSDNPVFPIENTVTNFNIDMIGRIDYNYEDRDEEYIYVIGAEIISSKLDSLLHVANDKSEQLKIDMLYNDLDDRNQFYRRSDHWNFGRLGIPFIFFFSGVHDDYHQPSDTVDKIEFDLMERRARLIFATLIEVANAPERPVMDNEEFINRTRAGR